MLIVISYFILFLTVGIILQFIGESFWTPSYFPNICLHCGIELVKLRSSWWGTFIYNNSMMDSFILKCQQDQCCYNLVCWSRTSEKNIIQLRNGIDNVQNNDFEFRHFCCAASPCFSVAPLYFSPTFLHGKVSAMTVQ